MEFFARDGSIFFGDRKITIKGANWFGFETEVYGLHGLWSVSLESVLDFLQANGFNALRVPFSAEVALGLDELKCKAVDASTNPALVGCTAGQMLDRLVQECGRRGILVMPDLHRFVGTGNITELWYDASFPETRVIEAWSRIVRRYLAYPNVFAVDLKNEPHGRATWGAGNPATDWDAAAARIGNALLKINPRLLIVVEGVERGPGDDNSWWGGTIAGSRTHPVRLDVPDKLVYSPHVYGPSVFPQPYFADAAFPANLEAIWDRHFGFAEQAPQRATLMIGEFGGTYEPHIKDDVWQNTVGEYFARRGIDWFYWCVNPNSGDTKGLLADDWRTPVRAKLDLLKRICPNPTKFPSFGAKVQQPPPVQQPVQQQPPVKPAPAQPEKPAKSATPDASASSKSPRVSVRVAARNAWVENGNDRRTVWDVTVTNDGTTTASDAQTRFRIRSGRIHSVWNVTTTDDAAVVRLPDYLRTGGLLPGQSFTFGFIASAPQQGNGAGSPTVEAFRPS